MKIDSNYIPELPYHLVWITTNACNARCLHCSTAAAKRLPNELSTDEVKSLFTHLADIGIFDVAISGGEPLVRQDIYEIIEFITGLGIKVGIGSNGSLITKQTAFRLKEIHVDRLQISIDGTEEIHDQVRRWNGLFNRAKQAIQNSIEAGLNTHVCLTLHKLNYAVMEDVIDTCANWGVKRFNMSRFIPTGRGTNDLDLPKEIWKEIIFEYETIKKKYSGTMELTTHLSQSILVNPELYNCGGFIGCQAGIGQGCIDSNGDIRPCVMLPIVIGNVREKLFEDIWKSSQLINSLKSRNTLKGFCSMCDKKEQCGGCRAVAYSYSGDVFETDSRCWLVQ